MITYQPDKMTWLMSSISNPSAKAVTKASILSMALGKHEWQIMNDLNCQEENRNTITRCNEVISQTYFYLGPNALVA